MIELRIANSANSGYESNALPDPRDIPHLVNCGQMCPLAEDLLHIWARLIENDEPHGLGYHLAQDLGYTIINLQDRGANGIGVFCKQKECTCIALIAKK